MMTFSYIADFDCAISDIDKSFKDDIEKGINPFTPEATFILGFLHYFKKNNKEEAIEWWSKGNSEIAKDFIKIIEIQNKLNRIKKKLEPIETIKEQIESLQPLEKPIEFIAPQERVTSQNILFSDPLSYVSETNTPQNLVTSEKKDSSQTEFNSFSDSLSKKNIEKIYHIMKDVSDNFFDFNKDNYRQEINNKIQKPYDEFCKALDSKSSYTINITGWSCRARIYLLIKIIEKNCEIINQTRETSLYFAIDNHKYKLELNPKDHQPGNGKIKGLLLFQSKFDNGLSHDYICKYLNNEISKNLAVSSIWERILKQKQDGELIKMNNKNHTRFINGYSLLLDFEIARRRIKEDKYKDLPLIVCYPFIMKYLDEKNKESSFNTLSKLFKGEREEREKAVEDIIEKAGSLIFKNQKEMRALLMDFHQSNENS